MNQRNVLTKSARHISVCVPGPEVTTGEWGWPDVVGELPSGMRLVWHGRSAQFSTRSKLPQLQRPREMKAPIFVIKLSEFHYNKSWGAEKLKSEIKRSMFTTEARVIWQLFDQLMFMWALTWDQKLPLWFLYHKLHEHIHFCHATHKYYVFPPWRTETMWLCDVDWCTNACRLYALKIWRTFHASHSIAINILDPHESFMNRNKPHHRKQQTGGRQIVTCLSKCFVSPDRPETSKTRCLLSILNDVTWEEVGKQSLISVYRILEVHFKATSERKGFISEDSPKKHSEFSVLIFRVLASWLMPELCHKSASLHFPG